MLICSKCFTQFSDGINFCTNCGTALTPVQPEPVIEPVPIAEPAPQPVYQPAYQPQAIQYEAVNAGVPTSAKIKGFIGMGLGIEAIFASIVALILSFICIALAIDYYCEPSVIGYTIGFTGVELAFSIAAVVLSSSARNAGFVSGASKAGKILGIISTVISGLALLLTFFSITMGL